jgi:hypothetical protein
MVNRKAIRTIRAFEDWNSDMKITDPSLWPSDFGPLRFQRYAGDPRCSDMFLLIADGCPVAELAPLDADQTTMLGPHYADALSRGDCWTLDLITEEGRLVETHLLCRPRERGGDGDGLSGELAAWGILTVLWGTARWAPKRG